MEYFANYDAEKESVIIEIDPVQYGMIISCTQSCWLPAASISKKADGRGYSYERWKYMDPGDKFKQTDLEKYEFTNGKELAGLLEKTGFSDTDNMESLSNLNTMLWIEYQVNLQKKKAL